MIKRLDHAGRVVIPKSWREDLRLEPGAPLEITLEDGRLVLKAVPQFASLRYEDGFPVFNSGRHTTPEDVRRSIEEVRAERERKFLNPRATRATHG